MRAGMAAAMAPGMVAPAAGSTALHRRGTHADNKHKHNDDGKQNVYAVRLSASLSASLSYGHTDEDQLQNRTQNLEWTYISDPRCKKRHKTNKSRQ